MSQSDYTKNILNIEDNNIFFGNDCYKEVEIKGVVTKVFYGILSYIPPSCEKCGVINNGFEDIIKWGFKHNCKVKIPKVSSFNSLLILSKQRFLCNHCNQTFIASTSLIDHHKNISKNSDLQVRLDLMDKSSEKDIAKRNSISTNSVNRILDNISSKAMTRGFLPEVMNWDEFKATKDTISKMAFIIANNKDNSIFDILNSRKSLDIIKYFRRYTVEQRKKVRFIVTDMYLPYIKIAHKMFKNAKVVIDKFHIVIQIYNALNITRVKLCYKDNPHYNKLKNFWKLIVKNENDLSDKKEYSSFFHKDVSQKDIVTFIINTNPTLKADYNFYQSIINSIKDRDKEKFIKLIHSYHKNISHNMIKALNTYRSFEPYILESFNYDYNNGLLEGTNNLIKCLKRISFGFRKFSHFKTRIFLIKGIINPQKKVS